MKPAAFHRAALALKGAACSVKWGGMQVYTVGQKMFAVAGPSDAPTAGYKIKVSDLAYEMLIETRQAIPAPYLARAKWVEFAQDSLSDREFKAFLAEAHAIVAAKLTRKLRTGLGL